MAKSKELQAATTAEPSEVPMQKKLAIPTRAAGLFGEIVRLMMLSPAHKHLFLADLEWFVLPPFANKQFQLFSGESGISAVALWASVSAEIDKDLSSGRTRLKPSEWKSGDNLWLMEIVAPTAENTKVIKQVLSELSNGIFRGRRFKVRLRDVRTGKLNVAEVGAREKN